MFAKFKKNTKLEKMACIRAENFSRYINTGFLFQKWIWYIVVSVQSLRMLQEKKKELRM